VDLSQPTLSLSSTIAGAGVWRANLKRTRLFRRFCGSLEFDEFDRLEFDEFDRLEFDEFDRQGLVYGEYESSARARPTVGS